MSRKGRNKKNPNDEIEAMRKIFCDEASNQMKMRNFAKAVIGYNQKPSKTNNQTPTFHRISFKPSNHQPAPSVSQASSSRQRSS
ncbi:unnamed protein product [Chironomus riparius]|uniref:Uncharacterized protein n=1 Tax=Chironomus riparius TaxID=315576 RepID=A0A9N9S927_9DIPT|nr:unnamed protein product [Chironomus riparius]